MTDKVVSADRLIGSTIGDRYRIKGKLGEGSAARVYVAFDALIDSDVAIKIMNYELGESPEQHSRFMREVQLTRQITHPSVVRTFDVGMEERHPYVTMEYVQGKSLAQLIEEGLPSVSERASLLVQICEGLIAIHECGVIHRDLKPSNILVTNKLQAKIADFGIARPHDSALTRTDAILGTLTHIAPETWRSSHVSILTDIYALGVLAYELFTGQLPFSAASYAEIMRLHLEEKPEAPISLNPRLSQDLSDLILSLLEKSPSRRPGTVRQVLEKFERINPENLLFCATNFSEADRESAETVGAGKVERVGDRSGGGAVSSLSESPLLNRRSLQFDRKKHPSGKLSDGPLPLTSQGEHWAVWEISHSLAEQLRRSLRSQESFFKEVKSFALVCFLTVTIPLASLYFLQDLIHSLSVTHVRYLRALAKCFQEPFSWMWYGVWTTMPALVGLILTRSVKEGLLLWKKIIVNLALFSGISLVFSLCLAIVGPGSSTTLFEVLNSALRNSLVLGFFPVPGFEHAGSVKFGVGLAEIGGVSDFITLALVVSYIGAQSQVCLDLSPKGTLYNRKAEIIAISAMCGFVLVLRGALSVWNMISNPALPSTVTLGSDYSLFVVSRGDLLIVFAFWLVLASASVWCKNSISLR